MRVDNRRFAKVLAGIGRSMILGQSRSLIEDSRLAFECLLPQPVIEGIEQIPDSGPFLLVANHWQRPGLWIGFVGASLAVAIAGRRPEESVHWMVTDRWNIELGGQERTLPFTKQMFRRVARNWDMIPLPTGKNAAGERSLAVRDAIRRAVSGQVVGLFPEGEAGVAGPPGQALSGSADLAVLLARRGVPTLPAAFAEVGYLAKCRFGPPILPERGDDLMTPIRREYETLVR